MCGIHDSVRIPLGSPGIFLLIEAIYILPFKKTTVYLKKNIFLHFRTIFHPRNTFMIINQEYVI